MHSSTGGAMICLISSNLARVFDMRKDPDDVLTRPAPRRRIRFDSVGRSGSDAGLQSRLGG